MVFGKVVRVLCGARLVAIPGGLHHDGRHGLGAILLGSGHWLHPCGGVGSNGGGAARHPLTISLPNHHHSHKGICLLGLAIPSSHLHFTFLPFLLDLHQSALLVWYGKPPHHCPLIHQPTSPLNLSTSVQRGALWDDTPGEENSPPLSVMFFFRKHCLGSSKKKKVGTCPHKKKKKLFW